MSLLLNICSSIDLHWILQGLRGGRRRLQEAQVRACFGFECHVGYKEKRAFGRVGESHKGGASSVV